MRLTGGTSRIATVDYSHLGDLGSGPDISSQLWSREGEGAEHEESKGMGGCVLRQT